MFCQVEVYIILRRLFKRAGPRRLDQAYLPKLLLLLLLLLPALVVIPSSRAVMVSTVIAPMQNNKRTKRNVQQPITPKRKIRKIHSFVTKRKFFEWTNIVNIYNLFFISNRCQSLNIFYFDYRQNNSQETAKI